MIKTNNTLCTYEELYYEMWETAGRYSRITRFQVIGSSHDERLIPAVWVGNGTQTVFCIAGMIGTNTSPSVLIIRLKIFCFAVAACFTSSLVAAVMPAIAINSS